MSLLKNIYRGGVGRHFSSGDDPLVNTLKIEEGPLVTPLEIEEGPLVTPLEIEEGPLVTPM